MPARYNVLCWNKLCWNSKGKHCMFWMNKIESQTSLQIHSFSLLQTSFTSSDKKFCPYSDRASCIKHFPTWKIHYSIMHITKWWSYIILERDSKSIHNSQIYIQSIHFHNCISMNNIRLLLGPQDDRVVSYDLWSNMQKMHSCIKSFMLWHIIWADSLSRLHQYLHLLNWYFLRSYQLL